MRSKVLSAPLALGLLLAGCAVGPDYHAPDLALPEHYRVAPSEPAGPAAHAPWWRSFADPQLDTLEAATMAQNLDLAQAAARFDQARAAAHKAGVARLPAGEVTLGAAGIRQTLVDNAAVARAFPFVGRDVEFYGAGVGASWELDLFGGLGRSAEAARAELEAAHADVAAARLMLSAEVADAYVRLRGAQQRQAILDKQIALLRNTAALVQLKVDQGVAARRDLDAAAAELAQAKADRPPLAAEAEGELDRLSVLTGRRPEADRGDLATAAAIPRPAPLPAGAPADLLRRRPDLIVAERRLAAANARIGAAISEYYPKVDLQGVLGASSLNTGTLLAGPAGLAAVGLRWRLFDFGRVSDEVAAARSRDAEALAAYQQAMLRAAADVEAALTARLQSAEQAARLADAEANLKRRTAATAEAYAAGGTSLLELMDAERQLLSVEDQVIQAQVAQALAETALARGTGARVGPD